MKRRILFQANKPADAPDGPKFGVEWELGGVAPTGRLDSNYPGELGFAKRTLSWPETCRSPDVYS
jgi:hypothetical protein